MPAHNERASSSITQPTASHGNPFLPLNVATRPSFSRLSPLLSQPERPVVIEFKSTDTAFAKPVDGRIRSAELTVTE
jgi:hypothetical protein